MILISKSAKSKRLIQSSCKQDVDVDATDAGVQLDDTICRVCLYAKGTVAVFGNGGVDEQFRYCTQLDAADNDGLPRHLCERCIEHLHIAYEFRSQAIYAESYFRKTTFLSESASTVKSNAPETDVLDENMREIKQLLAAESSHEFVKTPDSVKVITEESFNGFATPTEICDSDDSLSDHFAAAFDVSDGVVETEIVEYAAETTTVEQRLDKAEEIIKPKQVPLKQLIQKATELLNTTKDEKLVTKKKSKENVKSKKLGNIECNICGAKFSHVSSLKQHLFNHTGQRPFACEFCGKAFTRRTILNVHRRSHTGECPYSCDECIQTFITKEAMNRHKEREHNENGTAAFKNLKKSAYTCSICKKTCNFERSLKKHMLTHQSETSVKINSIRSTRANSLGSGKQMTTAKRCEICQKIFASKRELYEHQKTHDIAPHFECEACQRSFERKYELLYHLQTHDNAEALLQKHIEKPTLKSADEEDDDDLPLAVRLKQRPRKSNAGNLAQQKKCQQRSKRENLKALRDEFRCKLCQKVFSSCSTLKAHLRHHTGERPYRCEHCEKAFMRMSILKVHQRQHTGEKPYKCPLCEEHFRTRETQLRHVEHAHEKNGDIDLPYVCQMCSQTFPNMQMLQKHNAAKHAATAEEQQKLNELPPHKCRACSYRFGSWNDLVKHMDTHNPPKAHQCGVCQMKFEQKFKLLFHLELHKHATKQCQKCGAVFSIKEELLKHVKSVHFDEHNLEQQCAICMKRFYDRRNLKQHQCEAHDISMRDINACELCGINYRTAIEYYRHVYELHDDISKACSECSQRFTSRRAFDKHILTHYT